MGGNGAIGVAGGFRVRGLRKKEIVSNVNEPKLMAQT